MCGYIALCFALFIFVSMIRYMNLNLSYKSRFLPCPPFLYKMYFVRLTPIAIFTLIAWNDGRK